jgi:hypothetical protein
MKSKSKSKTKSVPAPILKLAGALGVSRQLINYHVKKTGAPKLSDVPAWEEYLAEHGRIGSAPPELRIEIAKERLAILRAVRHAKERENKVKDDLVCDVPRVSQFIHDLVGNCFFGELERQANEYPSTLKGKNEVAIYEECLKQMESAKKTLRLRLEAWDRGEMRKP